MQLCVRASSYSFFLGRKELAIITKTSELYWRFTAGFHCISSTDSILDLVNSNPQLFFFISIPIKLIPFFSLKTVSNSRFS